MLVPEQFRDQLRVQQCLLLVVLAAAQAAAAAAAEPQQPHPLACQLAGSHWVVGPVRVLGRITSCGPVQVGHWDQVRCLCGPRPRISGSRCSRSSSSSTQAAPDSSSSRQSSRGRGAAALLLLAVMVLLVLVVLLCPAAPQNSVA